MLAENKIIEKVKFFIRENAKEVGWHLAKDKLPFNYELLNLLTEVEEAECHEMFALLIAITEWKKESRKSADRVFQPKSMGGQFELNSFEVKYLFLKIMQVPFELNELDEELLQSLQEISRSIFVTTPYRIGQLTHE